MRRRASPAPCDRKSTPANEVSDPEPLDAAKQPPIDRYCDLVLTGGVTDGVIYPWRSSNSRVPIVQKHRRHLRRRAGSGGDGGGGVCSQARIPLRVQRTNPEDAEKAGRGR